MPCLLPIIVRAKAHSVVITNPSLKAGVNTKALRHLYTRSVHHKSQSKGRGNGRMVWTQATGSLVTSNMELSTICRSLTPAFRLGCRHTTTLALALTAHNMAFFTHFVYKPVGAAPGCRITPLWGYVANTVKLSLSYFLFPESFSYEASAFFASSSNPFFL